MLPAAYQVPAAIALVVGGAVACFFGYRLFRVVLSIFGFIFGGLMASSLVGPSDTTWLIGAWIVGGLIGLSWLWRSGGITRLLLTGCRRRQLRLRPRRIIPTRLRSVHVRHWLSPG